MEAAFMARSYDHVNSRLLATLSALDGGDNMHPGEPGAFDLVLPADGVAGGGEDHFEVVLNIGVLFPDLDGPIDHDGRMLLELRRYHDVDAEDATLVFG